MSGRPSIIPLLILLRPQHTMPSLKLCLVSPTSPKCVGCTYTPSGEPGPPNRCTNRCPRCGTYRNSAAAPTAANLRHAVSCKLTLKGVLRGLHVSRGPSQAHDAIFKNRAVVTSVYSSRTLYRELRNNLKWGSVRLPAGRRPLSHASIFVEHSRRSCCS